MSRGRAVRITCDQLDCLAQLAASSHKQASLVARANGWEIGMRWGRRIELCPDHKGQSR